MSATILKPNSYTYVVRLDKAKYKIDFVTCSQPKETLSSFYKRQAKKPAYLINGGLFNMKTGAPVFTFEDENSVKSTSTYNVGFGVDISGFMSFGVAGNPAFKDFVSGYPYLIGDGKKTGFTYAQELAGRNPRTALGYNDKYYFLVAVDGRTPKNKGMTFSELQDLFLSLGATYAINLDGGGSTRMMENGVVVNQPTEDRPVDNVICAYLRETVEQPTEDKKMKLYLSPSTQEANICSAGDREEDHCNKIADELVKYLDAAGIEYKRNTKGMDHISSTADSNAYKPDIHYALHSNAADGTVRGQRVYVYSLGGKAEAFAKVLVEYQTKAFGTAGEVAVPDTKYTEIYKTAAPAVIDEVAFHDNPEDAKWIHNNICAIARNKAQAICKYFNVPFVEISKTISIAELKNMGYTQITL
jgi:N-acetylmuramoyl-L-alanine amidase